MVEFLQDVKGNGFMYEKGKRYVSMDDFTNENLKDKTLVRQPNSPKKTNWWSQFSKSDDGVLFKTLETGEMSITEILEENKALQY